MAAGRAPPTIMRLLNSVRTFFQIIFCFVCMYLTLFIFLLPILFVLGFRCFLSVLFFTYYGKGRYKLVECANACYTMDKFGSIWTVYLFAYIKGPCDITFLRKRIHIIFTKFKRKNGSRPYEVMLCSLITKFGFPCWENTRDSFDINHHIRYLTGCCDPRRIYTEEEVLQAAAELADDLWPESRPRWEFLVVPRMKRHDSDDVCSVIHFRIHHSYVDGISLAQLIRLCVADKPPPTLAYDPVSPPIPPKPLWMKVITFLQVIFLGPWAAMTMKSGNEESIFMEGPLFGRKYFGKTKIGIPIENVRKIRRFYKCSTTAIQHYIFTGALRKLAERKGAAIPRGILASIPFALLPYPHEYPVNHASGVIKRIPIGKEGLERLLETNQVCSWITHPMHHYAVLTIRLFLQIIGLFPSSVIEKGMGSIKMAYSLSNVPGIKDEVYLDGKSVLNVFGVGPLINGTRYSAGVTCYKEEFTFGFIIEQSQLIEDQQDLNYFIEQFEREMKALMDSVNICF